MPKVKKKESDNCVLGESKKAERRQRKKMSRGVTLNEMENVAISFGDDTIGNVIDLGDSSDSLGLDMLANPSRSINISNSGASNSNTYSIPTSQSGNSGMGEIEINKFDTLEPITLNLGDGMKSGGTAPIEIEIKKAEAETNIFSNSQTATGPGISLSPAFTHRNIEEEKREKIEYLNKLQRLEQKGFPISRKFTMDNSLEEVKQEYMRLVDARQLEASLRFQRQALVGVVTGMEWLNGRFDPFDLKLDGWSESVHENVEDFDEIFEELYDKYKERGKMPPEMRLLMTLAGSGFMCHVSNTFLRSRMPSADDVLRNNPDLARQFAGAAASQAGPGFGKFMNMAMGQPQEVAPEVPQSATGAFFGSSASQPRAPANVASVEPPRQTARREMKGPSGVDDILKQFEEARAREIDIPQSPMSQPAVTAAVEIQSMASDDLQSAVESTRTGRSGRRRRAAVSGNTISLAV
jgi:hypothetical protein